MTSRIREYISHALRASRTRGARRMEPGDPVGDPAPAPASADGAGPAPSPSDCAMGADPAITSSPSQSRHTTSGSAAKTSASSPSSTRSMKYGSTANPPLAEHAIPGCELERRQHPAAERKGQAPGQALDVDSEPGDMVEREVDAYLAQQPNRDEVARLVQRRAQEGSGRRTCRRSSRAATRS